ncbi:FAD binding domain-containing protein [Allomesorhizobium camelthorni]|uniref:Xanthine dehydrogenase family protein subunit M n=1 Tax=Allomesorhizobium camelthorni TaxID=475069 RepID=A0A6G4WDJ9_9HYPH|nr:FAD binding domain-containing protein [Mesorhizobium camelthorni]NGO52187.1 xanthine dehydrogenase family protein subunit M [Mesorhizobium camelthorni]
MLQAVIVPGSLALAQEALARHPGAVLMAGGTVVMPVLNYGTDSFDTLVSLRKAGLSGIFISDGKASIGAATSLSELQERPELAFLGPAIDTIASPTIRNMATVGGNLFVEQPYGDLAVCLIALGATAAVADGGAARFEPVESLVRSGVAKGEIVTKISFTLPAPGTFKFVKATRRAFNSAAIVTVAAVIGLEDGKVAECRIALGGVAKHPLRAKSVEEKLLGQTFDRAGIMTAAEAAGDDIEPFDDAYASAWYRRRVTPVHIRRALIGE